MISLASAWAIALRHLYLIKRDINVLLFQLYWPLLDIMLMGFLGSWIQQSQTQLHNYQVSALLGILLWQVVGRGCNSIVLAFTEELWSNNLLSLFSLPLNIFEWILGCIINYIIAIFIVTVVSIIFMFLKVHFLSIRNRNNRLQFDFNRLVSNSDSTNGCELN
jgi:ABC-2 type transport system permease protein